jgi:hypothetical protein
VAGAGLRHVAQGSYSTSVNREVARELESQHGKWNEGHMQHGV